jgi:polygalacturonase
LAVPSAGWASTTGSATGSARNILEFGAKPDGKTLNTTAIQRAIDEVFQAGGGLVYAPPGVFLVGGLELKSRVTLYLEAGCVLLGSTSIDDYAYRPGVGVWGDANGHHVIFARDADDVTLCGSGTIDGQGSAYWQNVHRPPTAAEDLWQDCVAFDYKPIDNHRPSPMLEFAMCRNLKINGITLKGAAGWTLRPIACETVVIDGIRIRNPDYGSNTDGIDITCCRNVMVCNCDISTGDDAICLKSENSKNCYGAMLPTKNITVTNCILTTSCNGFKMGTATHGSFENIVFSNSVIYNNDSDPLNARVMSGIAVEMVDGGSVDGVAVSNIRMQNVRAPIFVRLAHRTGNAEDSFLRNVLIDGIDATGSVITNTITGIPGLRPSDITVSNSRIRTSANGTAAWAKLIPPELTASYPESRLFGHFPAYGFYVRHADRVRLRNIELMTDKPDERPAVICEDVEDAILSGLEASAPIGGAPLIDLRNTRRAFLTGMRAPAEVAVFAQVGGEGSSGIALTANCIGPKQQAVRFVDGASADSTTHKE